MAQKITKIAGNALGTTYAAWIAQGSGYGLPQATAEVGKRTGNWPLFSALSRPARRFNLHVVILPGGGDTERKNLFDWLDPESETPFVLTATDADGTSNERYLNVICEDCRPAVLGDRPNLWEFIATCVVDGDVRWRHTNSDVATWSVAASGSTKVCTNGGEDDAYPILAIQPTAMKTGIGGYDYRAWVPLIWRAVGAQSSYPFRIGPLDTATLIHTATATTLNGGCTAGATSIALTDASSFPTAGMGYITDAVPGDEQISWTGKSSNTLTGCTRGIGGTSAGAHSNLDPIVVSYMLDNGDDLRVYFNGVEQVNRWFVSLDNAATYIWTYADFSAGQSYTLAADITAAATTLTVNEAITSLPATGIVYVDTEAMTYTGKNNTDKKLTGLIRGAKDSTAATHSSGATAYWVENECWLYYGNESASAPAVNAHYEPIFTIASSTNTSWVYANFGENDGLRTGSWVSEVIERNPTFYTANRTTDADPWSEIGVRVTEPVWGSGESGRWKLYNPCTITNVNFSNGEKRAVDKAWFGGQVQSKAAGAWVTEYTIPIPAADNTWADWSYNAALTASSTYVGLYIVNINTVTQDVEAADVTVTLSSSYTPLATVTTAVANTYNLACSITNSTTSKAIAIAKVMALADTLTVDTYAKTITLLSDSSSQMQALTVTGGPRRDWLALQPSANTLTYTEAGAAGLTITVTWAERFYS